MTLVRPATVADAAAIARIRIECWRTTYSDLVAADVLGSLDVAADTNRFAERLAVASAIRTLVVDEAGAVKGFCVFGPDRDEPAPHRGEIYALYVAPTAQGLGLGTSLIEASVTQLVSEGMSEIRLWALTGNHPAHAFYTARGFVLDGGERELEGLRTPDGSDAQEVRYLRAVEAGRA